MARDLTTALKNELTAPVLSPVIFYEGEFASGFVRLWSGYGDLLWNGQTWQGVGHLAGISPIQEDGQISAKGITVSLSGIPQSLIAVALSEARQGKPGKIWLGAMDSAGAVVVDPYLSFSGRLDVPEIDEGADTATITITYESRLIDLERPRERRYTANDQALDYPGDKGFDYIPSLQDKQIVWGR